MTSDTKVLRFVTLLLRFDEAGLEPDGSGLIRKAGNVCRIDPGAIRDLVAQGIVARTDDRLLVRAEARSWPRRKRLSATRAKVAAASVVPGAPIINLDESPMARLAALNEIGSAFLLPHQVLAGERFRSLFERAHLRQRVTMSYDATGKVDRSTAQSTDGISDMGLDARNRIDALVRGLPDDAAKAVMGVCGHLKGVQLVERENHWPRRSGKMLLRVGLDLLAGEMGLGPQAEGPRTNRSRTWLGDNARPLELS
ncbi:MAG: hypothetical protein KDJ19_11300 [Hyphomicrobiaceae bacterium]|nr:hypothetical protein [Hyphomicrobiaceae bacterium]MCC0023156.1 hypothetical protein [Hyphomicrobiaceae bacterium]